MILPSCLKSRWGNTHLLMLLVWAVTDCFYVLPPSLLSALALFLGISKCPQTETGQMTAVCVQVIYILHAWLVQSNALGRHLLSERVDQYIGVVETVCSHIVDLLKLSLTKFFRHILNSCTEHPQSSQDVSAYSSFKLCNKLERKWKNSCHNDVMQFHPFFYSSLFPC